MALREILADLRVRVRGTEQLRAANSQVTGLVSGLRGAGAAFAAFAAASGVSNAVGAVADFSREMIAAGDNVGKVAQQLGLTTDQLQAWRFAADRSGVDAQAMDQSFVRLQRAAFEAARGTATYRDAFRALGVDVRDSNGNLLEADALMRAMAVAMAGVENETEKVALAQQLMGRSGARLLPLLNGGAEGAEALLARFEELGGGLGEDFVHNAEAAQDAITDWDTATLGIKSTLANSFLPTLTRALNAFTEIATDISRVLERSRILQITLGALGVVAATVAAALLLIAAPVLVPLGALLLLVEDLVVMFEGGNSAIGAFIDQLFGVGSAQAVVERLTEAWRGLLEIMQGVARLARGEDFADRGGVSNVQEGLRRQRERREAQRAAAEAGQGGRTVRVPSREVLAAANARPTLAAPTAGVGGRTEITQNVGAPTVNVTVQGGNGSEEDARRTAAAVEDSLSRVFSRAAATLPQAGEAT